MIKAAKAMYILALVLSAGICVSGVRDGIETDLYSLLGERRGPLSALAKRMSNVYRVICPDEAGERDLRGVAAFDPPVDFKELHELVRTHGRGLLDEQHAEMLERGETNRIIRSAMRRDFAGVGLFPKADDPWYLLNDFVISMGRYRPDGILLSGSDAGSVPALLDYVRAHDEVVISGAPFHSYLAKTRAVGELNALGAVSLIAVIALGCMLFRSPSFIPPLVAALAGGFIIGAAALFLLPGRPHVLTFLFSTSLIGLGVDYCYHALNGSGTSALSRALVTSAVAFVPLVFASVPVLREMAVFTVVGLTAIYGFVRIWCVRSR